MSKVKLFDKNIFLEDLRQLKTINVICGVILLLEAVLVPLYAFIVRPDPDQVYYSSTNTVPLYVVGPLVLCVALAMPVMTNILFDFIDKRNSSDFYHSLPVRRETMYITHIVAVLLSCLALFIIPSVVEYVLFLPLSYMKITLGDFGYVFADVVVLGMLLSLAGNLLIYGIIESYGHYQSKIFPDANQITSVEFIENGNFHNSQIGIISYPSGYYFDNLIGEVEFTDDEFVSMIAEKLEQTLDEVKYGGYYSCNDVCVKIKYDGGTIYRRLYIDDEDWDMFVYNVIESDEYFAAADMLPDFDSKGHSYSNTKICYDVGYYSTSVDLETSDFLKIYESYKNELATLYRHKQYSLAVSEYQGKPFISFTLDSNYIMRLAVDEELMPETYSLVERYLNITYAEPDLDEEEYDDEV